MDLSLLAFALPRPPPATPSGPPVPLRRRRVSRAGRWWLGAFTLCWLLTGLTGLAAAAPKGDAPAEPPPLPAGAPAGMAEPIDPAVRLVSPVGEGSGRLAHVWVNRQRAQGAGEHERAASLEKAAAALCREHGVARHDALGYALLGEAEAAYDAGNSDEAHRLIESAEALAPGLPELALARARFALGGFAVHTWLIERVRALRLTLADHQSRMLLFSEWLLTLLVVGAAVAFGFLGVQLVRYGAHLYHDLGEAFPALLKVVVLGALGILAAVPLVFGFGPLLLVAPLVVLLWPYQARTERIVAGLVLVALGATPWMLRVGDRLSEAGTGLAQAMQTVELNPFDTRARQRVAAEVDRDPFDWLSRAVLGLAEKRAGNLDEAATLLTQARGLVSDPVTQGVIDHNLGNVWFAMGRPKAAEAAYQAAIKALPDAAEPLFGLHRLYQRQRRLAEADQTIAKASRVDATRVATWNQDTDAGINRHVVDLPTPALALTRRATADLLAPTPFAHQAWVRLAGPLPDLAGPMAGMAALLMAGLLLGVRNRLRLSWPCHRCGARTEVYLVNGRPERPQCTVCDLVFAKGAPMEQRARFAHETRVARWTSLVGWVRRLAAVSLPGTGPLSRGQALRGVLLLGLTACLALFVWLPDGLLVSPYTPPSQGRSWAPLVALTLLWSVGIWRTWRNRGSD